MSNAMWNSHLTPESLIMDSFPTTPTQSFEMYQTNIGTSLGKRPRQPDVEDFTQSKRHEPTGDYTLSSFSSASPQMDVVQGLSDEAADVCTTWFNKYAVLPSDRHIDSLSQLTGESADAIRQWFGRLLKQGMGGADSAYKSQTDMMPALYWSDSYTTDLVPTHEQTGGQVPQQIPTPQLTQENTVASERRSSNDTTVLGQPASTLRGGKKRCAPTKDQDLLARDPNKVYQCTRKCGKRYGRKCDWKRNEEEGYPCKSWVCSLCTSEGVENVRPCFRKYHFVQVSELLFFVATRLLQVARDLYLHGFDRLVLVPVRGSVELQQFCRLDLVTFHALTLTDFSTAFQEYSSRYRQR